MKLRKICVFYRELKYEIFIGAVKLTKMKGDCPVCQSEGSVEFESKTEKIPYFGEIMESTLHCVKCGYKHSDMICLEQKEPVRYSLVANKDNLNARVVRSQSATVSIPELGLKVEPGPKSQGYISNIEGILNRFEDAVKTALNFAEDEESKNNAMRILDNLEKIKNGEIKAEIIIEDPFGHSTIIHPEASRRVLTSEEINGLKIGFITYEKE